MVWSKFACRTLVNVFFVGTGVTCVVMSILDIIRDDKEYKEYAKARHDLWHEATEINGTGKSE